MRWRQNSPEVKDEDQRTQQELIGQRIGKRLVERSHEGMMGSRTANNEKGTSAPAADELGIEVLRAIQYFGWIVQHVVPKPPLADFVERFWHSSEAPLHQKVRIMPTGTMELVFNLDEDELEIYDTKQPGSGKSFSGAVFSGTYGRPLFVNTRKHVVGVLFKPGGAFRFLGVPASELADTHVDLEALWGRSTQNLREQLCAAANPTKCFRVLEKALVARLENTLKEHRAVRAALDIFGRDAGEARTRDLAARLGLSQRHFIKIFSTQVGVTPKQFCRVQRFQRALELTQSNSAPDWADIAAVCGYFDQSHLIHDFQTLSGLSPTEFHRHRSERVLMNHLRLAE